MNEPEVFVPNQPRRITMLLYGDPGVGKTCFAATAPDPIFLDAEDGMAAVQRQVLRWRVRNLNDLRNAFAWLQANPSRYRTVVLDSLVQVQYFMMQDTIRSFPSKARPMGDLPAQLDYVKVIQDTMRLVNALLTLDASVILITRTAPQRSSTDRIQPMFVGSTTASNVAALVDVVAYMAIEDGKRVIYTDHPQAITKSRILLPTRMENPVWEQIFQIPISEEV